MFIKHHILYFLIVFFIFLSSCQLQEPSKNHGILFLKNRSDKLILNVSNKNDVIKSIGQPHSKSINNENEWIFIERILTKGEFHKLGRNILKDSNILVLNFDKYGILVKKNFITKNDIRKLAFSEDKTSNELSQISFVQRFLRSLKDKMYRQR